MRVLYFFFGALLGASVPYTIENVVWEEMVFSFVLAQLLTSGKGPLQPAGGESAFSWRKAL